MLGATAIGVTRPNSVDSPLMAVQVQRGRTVCLGRQDSNFRIPFSSELPSLNLLYENSGGSCAAYAVLCPSTGVIGSDEDHSECKVSNPVANSWE